MIISREEMIREFDASMNRHRDDKTSKEDDWDSHIVKSYLIEAHLPENAPRQEAKRMLSACFSSRTSQIHATDDDDLLIVTHSVSGDRMEFAFDINNSRYWVAHTTGKSSIADKFIDRIVSKTTELDHAWIPTVLLDKVKTFGAFRGFKFSYERDFRFDIDKDNGNSEPLKLSLYDSNQAQWILDTLRGGSKLEHQTALARVKIRFGKTKSDSTTIDINYDGRMAARGASAAIHLQTVERAYRDLYIPQIRKLESRFAISIEADDQKGIRLSGEPVYFKFEKPIANLGVFCKSIFSSTEPFRLFGIPEQKGAKSFYVEAVDLHVGSILRMELFPDSIRVFLPKNSCGNSILRFYTNLQHHFDAKVNVVDADGGQIFE